MSGNMYAAGNITAYSSDVRLKENIVTIDNALNKLQKIRGVYYDWKDIVDDLGFNPIDRHDIGVIAQEVGEVIPQAIKPAPFDTGCDGKSESGENYVTVQMEKIIPWAKKKNLLVIEDCAHTIGGIYKDKMLGTWGDISCFSFEEKKMLTTGDGGMICTNNKSLAAKFRSLSFHGWNRDPWSRYKKSISKKNLNERHWYYQIKDLGFKYNMNDLMAAIGQAQLKKLNSFNLKRNLGVKKYLNGIQDCKNIKPYFLKKYKQIAYWMFAIRSKKRDQLITFLKKRGIATSVYWIPVPMHPLYKKFKSKIPVTKRVWRELVTLPLFSDIKKEEINYVIKYIKEFDQQLIKN
jgi:perosamine synthetase